MSGASIAIGIDTGGTFTDLVAYDAARGRHARHKLASTGEDPSAAILAGIEAVLAALDGAAGDIAYVGHGTTVATNAVLEGTVARTGMITTRGFRDVVEIARQRRPHFFNLEVAKPRPAAPRECRLEVAGRLAEDGTEVEPLDEAGVEAAVEALRRDGVEAVAVCFLHSYADPAHERRAAEIVRDRWPDVPVTTSVEVLAELREFERFATTMMNASLLPVMDRYLSRFETGCRALGIAAPPKVMQSNGGAVSAGAVRRLPVNTLFSGPAGGVVASQRLGAAMGEGNLLTFDMGGTSTDVSLIRDGRPATRNERMMAGWPVRARTLDIHTIGAGGGSIAWIDPGGLLKVGPESAGAAPGPAGYGRGGTRATVTDANIVLGRLNPVSLLDGRMAVHADKALAAVDALAGPLGLDATRAAAGIVDIVNANMMGAVRVVSVEQGEDPRDNVLVAFGGAGPLHATEIAAELGIRRILVPRSPGLFSAAGLLHAETRGDFSLTRILAAEAGSLAALNAGLAELARRGEDWRAGEGLDETAVRDWRVDMRYRGQSFELDVQIAQGRLDADGLARALADFHARHLAVNGYQVPDGTVEIVTLRHALAAARPPVPAEASTSGAAGGSEARPVWFPATGFVETPVHARRALAPGQRLTGPLVIEQMDTTTLVPPGAAVTVHEGGDLLLELAP